MSAIVRPTCPLPRPELRSRAFPTPWSSMSASGRTADVRRQRPSAGAALLRAETPNYWFPFEPHFRTVGFQYLPERLRVMMLRRFALGFFQKFTSDEDAWNTRLASPPDLDAANAKALPDAAITHENCCISTSRSSRFATPRLSRSAAARVSHSAPSAFSFPPRPPATEARAPIGTWHQTLALDMRERFRR